MLFWKYIIIYPQEMAVHYGIGQLYVRSGLKVLQHTKVLGKFVQDKGRQQTDTYYTVQSLCLLLGLLLVSVIASPLLCLCI